MRIAHNDEYSSQKVPQHFWSVVPMAAAVTSRSFVSRLQQLLLSYSISTLIFFLPILLPTLFLLPTLRIIYFTESVIILYLAIII